MTEVFIRSDINETTVKNNLHDEDGILLYLQRPLSGLVRNAISRHTSKAMRKRTSVSKAATHHVDSSSEDCFLKLSHKLCPSNQNKILTLKNQKSQDQCKTKENI